MCFWCFNMLHSVNNNVNEVYVSVNSATADENEEIIQF